jgi:hypothetical protein
VRGKGEGKCRIPQTNFKTYINKNAIKPLLTIFPESLDPPRGPLGILAKISGTPSPGHL